MLGLLLTALFTIAATGAAWAWLRSRMEFADPAERLGVSALIGLGLSGILILLIGLVPNALRAALAVTVAMAAVGLVLAIKGGIRKDLSFSAPKGAAILGLIGFGLLLLFALPGVLLPSTSMDWDSLAYHLAVPKLWLQRGQIDYVATIHHSNFPFAVDNLYILGEWWGGYSGAKAFSWLIYLAGGFAIFGLARRWFSTGAAWMVLPAYGAVPVAAWEASTAYIDHAHGLYALIALAYGAEVVARQDTDWLKEKAMLCGLGLGFCLATKYTGLQVAAAVGLAFLILTVAGKGLKESLRPAAWVAGLAILVALPWYAKTAIYTGSPVYPFFNSVFPSDKWDEKRAEVYTEEQKTFGVGTAPADLGHAIFGLAVQPGRFVNPRQDVGGGFPTGGIGFFGLAGALVLLAFGRVGRREGFVLASCGVLLLMWFFLSQQSRYLAIIAFPLALVAGSLWEREKARALIAGAAAFQVALTLFILYRFQAADQATYLVAGAQKEYLEQRVGFAKAVPQINALRDQAPRVALYDEVFGYLLDVDYYWANPGHSRMIDYDGSETADEYADELRRVGTTHVYFNLAFQSPEFRDRWMQAAGLATGSPWSEEEQAELDAEFQRKWQRLLADAVRVGELRPLGQAGSGLLFEVAADKAEEALPDR